MNVKYIRFLTERSLKEDTMTCPLCGEVIKAPIDDSVTIGEHLILKHGYEWLDDVYPALYGYLLKGECRAIKVFKEEMIRRG